MLSRLSINTSRKLLLNLNVSTQKITKCKISSLTCKVINVSLRNNHAFNIYKHSKVIGIFPVRHQSYYNNGESIIDTAKEPQIQEAAKSANDLATEKTVATGLPDIPDIPEVPVPQTPEIVETIAQLHPNGEPTLASIGLGGYSPIGIIQLGLEWFHVTLNLPWWTTIMIGAVCFRLLLFPLVVISQRNIVNTANHLPEMQRIQTKMTAARQCGNEYEASMYTHQLMTFSKEKKLNPLKTMMVTMIQAPVFFSFFVGLRRMANAPVESLKTGGLWWFTDLTVSDPHYILPVIAATTMYIMIEFGLLTNRGAKLGKSAHFFRACPLLVFPFMLNFPGAILCYWITTNCISIVQVGVLKVEAVRKLCKIPPIIVHPKESFQEKQSFMDGFNNAWENIKISKQLEDKVLADSVYTQKIEKGALKKMLQYDPAKMSTQTAAQILSKKR